MTREEILAIESLSKQEISSLVAYIKWAEATTKSLKGLLDATLLGHSQKKINELTLELHQLITDQADQAKEIVPLTFGRIEAQLAPTLANLGVTLSPDERVVDEWFRVASTCRMTQYIFTVVHHILKRKLLADSEAFEKTSLELEKITDMFKRDYSQIRNLYTVLVRHDLLGAGTTDPFNEAELEASMLFDSGLCHVLPSHFAPAAFPTKQ